MLPHEHGNHALLGFPEPSLRVLVGKDLPKIQSHEISPDRLNAPRVLIAKLRHQLVPFPVAVKLFEKTRNALSSPDRMQGQIPLDQRVQDLMRKGAQSGTLMSDETFQLAKKDPEVGRILHPKMTPQEILKFRMILKHHDLDGVVVIRLEELLIYQLDKRICKAWNLLNQGRVPHEIVFEECSLLVHRKLQQDPVLRISGL